MIQIYLNNIHCHKETDEVGADEPYVLVTVVDLASSVNVGGFPVPLPAFEVVRYGPFEDVDEDETHFAPGASLSFWSVNGSPAVLDDPDRVIFVVALMENDDGDPEALRGIVKGIVGGSVLGSLSLNRGDKVTALIRDVNSALGTPTGAPSFDEKVGDPQELRFSRDELARAERGELVSTTLFTRGDGAHYTMTFEVRNPEQWRRWFQIHPEAVFDHTTQQIAAVSRAPGNLDLFVIGFDNAIWTTFWNDAGGWNPGGWFQIHPETVFDHTTQQIAAVSRAPGNLDLFVIGFDNAIWTTFWNDAGGWNPGGWFQIHPETVFDHTTQQIAAVSRAPGNLDLFVIGFDNAIWTTFWNDAVGWNPGGWFQIHPETVFDHTTQQIAAVSASARQSRPFRHRFRQRDLDHLLERRRGMESRWLVPNPPRNCLRPHHSTNCRSLPSPRQSRPLRHRFRQRDLDHLLERHRGMESRWLVPNPPRNCL